jgi:hypothetical protein
MPGESVLHDDREPGPVHSDGLSEEESGNDPLNKKAPPSAGLSGILADYFFFFVAFFFAGAFFFVAIIVSPPILVLFTTIAHLFRVSSLFKNIFKTCHLKIQSKNRSTPCFLKTLSIGYHDDLWNSGADELVLK